MSAIIEVEHVTKVFRLGQLGGLSQSLRNFARRAAGSQVDHSPDFKALDDISFRVDKGEVVGVIGHNGAGKSTLLKLLANISVPSAGRLAVHGRVAPLIEVGAGLVPEMTGRENIFLNAAILGMRRQEIARKFDEIVEFAEIEPFIDTPVKRYSSGMQVRLGFAIATSVESEILIVDEVLAVGDLAFQRKCFDRMGALIRSEGRTVLLVSHNIRQVERLCDRVIFMDHGRIRKIGAAQEVCNAFYEYSDALIAEGASAASRQSRRTTGECDLVDLAVAAEDGSIISEIEQGDDLVARIRLRVDKPLIAPIFVVGIQTTDFVNVTTVTSGTKFQGDVLGIGEHVIELRLDSLPLNPGAYSLRLSVDVEDPIKNVFYCDNIFPFCVRVRSGSRSDPSQEGFFRCDASWALRLEAGSGH